MCGLHRGRAFGKRQIAGIIVWNWRPAVLVKLNRVIANRIILWPSVQLDEILNVIQLVEGRVLRRWFVRACHFLAPLGKGIAEVADLFTRGGCSFLAVNQAGLY